jgi:hypothetical protein
MTNKITMVAIAALLLCCCVVVPAAYSQQDCGSQKCAQKCSMQTITGTYAFYGKGSSLLLDPTQQPYPLHFGGAIAPFANVGLITFNRNGVGDGYYWMFVGTLNGGYDPVPVHVTVTEMKEDCTGKYQYNVALPGIGTATIEECFFVMDNGREFRSIPFTIQNGMDSLVWLGTGHRISRSSKPPKSCRQFPGTYVVGVENVVASPDLIFAEAGL